MMKVAAIREKTHQELIDMIGELRKERLNIRMKRTSGEEFKPHRLKEIRRTIAQAMTVITEKLKNQPEGGK